MKKILTLSLALFSIFSATFAQNEGKIWYFGYTAGLSFKNGPPTPLSDGVINTSEGCAVMADANADLLFYTDGISVWNRFHQTMPNGYGLLGDPSSTQSGIIVPKPGSSTHYYIFTVPGVSMGNDNVGLNYTEIDMTLNGGKGDVVPGMKNKFLYSPATEKLTGFRYNDVFWVISHESYTKRFFVYKVTSSGVSATPVISSVGEVYDDWDNGAGYMKISPDGKYIGVAIYSGSGPQTNNGELYSFDATTGTVSNPIPLALSLSTYGMEFSPDGKRAYFGAAGDLVQYDMTAGSNAAIVASKKIASDAYDSFSDPKAVWALQLGPDGRLYTAHYGAQKIGQVVSPNNLVPNVNFLPASVPLNGNGTCNFGLPTFLASYFGDNVCNASTLSFLSLFTKSASCLGCANGKIVAAAKGGVPPYKYSIDGVNYQNSGIFNGLPAGAYTVYIKDANGCITKRVVKF